MVFLGLLTFGPTFGQEKIFNYN